MTGPTGTGAGRHRRLFVACRPPAAIRDELRALMTAPGIAWHADERLHITICFVGDVPMGRTGAVAHAIAHVGGGPLHLRLAGAWRAALPDGRALACLKIVPPDGLAHLHETVRAALLANGIAVAHRDYRPHLSLGCFDDRDGAGSAWLRAHVDWSGHPFSIDSYALYATETDGRGARHRLIARYRRRADNGTGSPDSPLSS